MKKTKIILILILLLGSFLRVYKLNKEIFFRIEAFSISYSNSASLISNTSRYWFSKGDFPIWFSEGHFPTYYLILHYWMQLFGRGEFSARFPSALFGIISIYLVYLLGKRLFEEKTALFASYLFAVSAVNIYYSQYTKPYSMVVCFVLLSFLSFLRALEKNTRFIWLGYITVTLFAVLLSGTTLPVVICQIIFMALVWPRHRGRISARRLVFVFSLVLFVCIPLLARLVLLNMRNGYLLPFPWIPRPSPQTFINIFSLFGNKIFVEWMIYIPRANPAVLTNAFGVILFLLCLVGIFTALVEFKAKEEYVKRKESASGLILSLWLIVPIAVPFIFSRLFIPIFGPIRFVLYASCAYYLLISKGVMNLRGKARIVLTVYIILTGLFFAKDYYSLKERTNWKEICNYIKENIRNDEKAAFIPYKTEPEYLVLSYYQVPSLVAVIASEDFEKPAVMDLAINNNPVKIYKVEELDCKGLWLLTYTPPGLEKLHMAVIKKLQDKYGSVDIVAAKRFDFIAITLYHFRAQGG